MESQWDRQDIGTTAKSRSPWDVPGTPNGTVGQTGHWDNLKHVGVLGMTQDSQWDCGTDRTLGQPQRCGSPWDDPGIPSPLSGTWDSPIGNRNAVGVSGHEWFYSARLVCSCSQIKLW